MPVMKPDGQVARTIIAKTTVGSPIAMSRPVSNSVITMPIINRGGLRTVPTLKGGKR